MQSLSQRRMSLQVKALLIVIAAGLLAGLVAAWFPRETLLAVGAMAFLAILGYYRSFVLSSMLVCGTVTILRDTSLGPISAMGALTIFLAFGTWGVWLFYRAWSVTILRQLSPALLFMAWGFVTLLWTPAQFAGIQNILVMTAFIGTILLSAEQSRRSESFQFDVIGVTIQASWLATIIYLLSLFTLGADADAGIGARGFALLALVGVGCCLAQWRYQSGRGLLSAAGIVAIIAFSLSRTAMFIGILLFPLSRWKVTTTGGWIRLLSWVGAGVVTLYVLVTRVDVVRSRFMEGDLAFTVGGIPINASGRMQFWEATLASHREERWIGQGAGSAQQLIYDLFGISHPHNDYLRIIHDFGLIGLALWTLAFLVLAVAIFRAWVLADRDNAADAQVHLAALLGLAAVFAAMVTDNVIVYIFVMVPLGALIGASLGRASVAFERKASDR